MYHFIFIESVVDLIEDKDLSWSTGVDIRLLNECFLRLPGYGDAKLSIEKSGSTTHLFMEPVSKIEVSAKDIRARINNPSLTDETHPSPNIDPEERSRNFENVVPIRKGIFTVQAFIFAEEISVTLTDDFRESATSKDEYIRLTMDSISLSIRPWTCFNKPLVCLNGNLSQNLDVILTVYDVQCDNQMYAQNRYDFPILLNAHQDDRRRIKVPVSYHSDSIFEQLKSNSLTVIHFTFDVNSPENVLKNIHVVIKPLNIYLEDTFIYKIARVLQSFQNPPKSPPSREEIISGLSGNLVKYLQLDSCTIEPINVLVSVRASIKMYIGVDQSPLNFTPFTKTSFICTSYSLGQNLARHYISGALFRAGWVVGSLELIGSPTGFTRTVGDGLKDFVALPYHGIFHGPWAFVSGVAHGSTSLVKHISAGTLTSMTNFASSVSRNLDRLSLDEEYCNRNEVNRRSSRPQGFGQGLVNGLSGVGISILGAVGGIAHHPLQALFDQGLSPTGFVGGITRGIVGVVTKPLGGAAEFVAQTGQGLLHGTGWWSEIKPRYPVCPIPLCALNSSLLKYKWKLLKEDNILILVEATKKSNLSAVNLLLTKEALFIVSDDEDAQESVYSLNEIKVEEYNDDPTELKIKIGYSAPPTVCSSADRVAAFVEEATLHCVVSEESSECTEAKKKSENDVVELVFYASPLILSSFHRVFKIAQRQLSNRGFAFL